MKLLDTQDMIGMPTPEASQFKPYKDIIDRDKSKQKSKAAKEFAYIYYLVHHESPYASWDMEIRPEKVKNDIFGKDSNWKPDEKVYKAIELYHKQIQNEYTRLLEAARTAANNLIKYFESLDLTQKDANGKLVYSAKDVISNISKVGEVVEGIDKLKEIIEKHQSKNQENRAGVETNKYNEG